MNEITVTARLCGNDEDGRFANTNFEKFKEEDTNLFAMKESKW